MSSSYDRAIILISSEQIRAARMLLRWEQRDLATKSGVPLSTLKRIETRPGPIQTSTSTLWNLQHAFSEAGIIFIDADDQHGSGVRMAKP
jgi:transcriptional regulator with XRE-family HTH domain